jgi:hypothetical protein
MRSFLVASVKTTRIYVAFMQGTYLYNDILGILVTLPSQTIKITTHLTSTKNPLITTSTLSLIAPAVLDAEAADLVADAVLNLDPELVPPRLLLNKMPSISIHQNPIPNFSRPINNSLNLILPTHLARLNT